MIVGTAGWSIPAAERAAFPAEGSALERYAQCFGGVEVNSSFHRRHRPATWQRWADSVPPAFRFAVKLPREISHARRLVDCETLIETIVEETRGLGEKLGLFLLQLPPKLAFDAETASRFFTAFAARTPVHLVCEPRHPSWSVPEAHDLLDRHRIARVAADPAPAPGADRPGGWRGLSYWRLHGSPQIYRSAYGPQRVRDYADRMASDRADGRPVWCIFDNTAASAATGDALALLTMV